MSSQSDRLFKQIETALSQSRQLPMWGSFPGFPWKAFSKAFAGVFKLKKFKMHVGTAEWKGSSSILSGMGRSPLQLSLEMSPLQGSVSLIVPSEDFTKLSSWAIDPKAGEEGFSDPFLQKGFFRYITLEAINLVDQMHVFPKLTPKLIDMPLSKEEAYTVDIALEKDDETVWMRLVCPPLFQESFNQHFASDWNLSFPASQYESINLELSLTAGMASFSQESWNRLKKGDFVFLDYCSYFPKNHRGTFQLMLDEALLFQVKLKEENIKILDYAHYYEDKNMSDDESPLSSEEEFSSESIDAEQVQTDQLVAPKKVPIKLTVEVAQLKMNLDQLLKLKPGNVLELGVSPEQGVNLVANGKCMAKGDLVQIGDVVGVKITKIGNA